MKKFIKSMLLLFVAATIVYTPTVFAQLAYSLPPEKVDREYTLPDWNVQEEKSRSKNTQQEPEVVVPEEQIVKKQTNPYTTGPSNLAFPKVPYPTAAIGQFISFCSNNMMKMFQYRAQQGQQVPPQIVQASTIFVCSCIMDNYRKNNEYAEYQYEFTRGTAKEVPLFTKYMQECSIMNQRNMMMNYDSNGAPTKWIKNKDKESIVPINSK